MNAVMEHQAIRAADAAVAAGASKPPAELSEARKAELLELARRRLQPQERKEGATYPVEALGPLAEACNAISEHGQLRPAMAGQSLLGAASLLTQGSYNVQTLAGVKPLSLYLLTMADSGDGKSTAEDAALRPVRAWQRERAKEYDAALEGDRGKKEEERTNPRPPFRLIRDATVEGLRRDLDTGRSSQGVFNAEGAAMLSGYGMNAENRSKTAAVFNGLWDDGNLSVSRVGSVRMERYGRRLCMHLLIQPSAAFDVVGDPLLSSIGLWPRFLLAWPEPSAPRLARPFHPERLPAVGDYWGRCNDLLQRQEPDDATDCEVIQADGAALSLFERAFERFEVEGKRGSLRGIKPFALRASEQAFRIAGVQAAFAARTVITAADAKNALKLVTYSLQSWCSMFEGDAQQDDSATAVALYRWLLNRPQQSAECADILRLFRPRVSASTRDELLAMLGANRLVTLVGGVVVVNTEER